jgi:transposase
MDSPMFPMSRNGYLSRSGASSAGSVPGGLAPQEPSAGITASSPLPAGPGTSVPNPQMTERATRRRFTAAYKISVIEQADLCTGRGELGALLRREGLYASTLANFRKQKAQGLLVAQAPRKPRASKDPSVQAALAQQAELERENRSLRRKLAHAERLIAIQKKVAILMGETLQEVSLDQEDW